MKARVVADRGFEAVYVYVTGADAVQLEDFNGEPNQEVQALWLMLSPSCSTTPLAVDA
jgi:hypothetical protein